MILVYARPYAKWQQQSTCVTNNNKSWSYAHDNSNTRIQYHNAVNEKK